MTYSGLLYISEVRSNPFCLRNIFEVKIRMGLIKFGVIYLGWFRITFLIILIFLNKFRDDSARSTTSEDEGVYSLKPPINGNYGRYSSGPPSITSAPEVLQNATSSNPNYFEEDLTPKHYIRSPIIEETESNVEAELRSRQRSRQQQRWIETIKTKD